MAFKNLVKMISNPHNLINVLLLVGFVTALTAPTAAEAQSGNIYRGQSTQVASPTMRAVILQSREVAVEVTQTSRYGASAVGAVLGGAIGAKMGENSNTARVAMGLIGSLLGGLGGQATAEKIGGSKAIEYIVQQMDGTRMSNRVMAITQPEPGPALNAGDRVFLIQTGGSWRVIADRQMASAPTPAVRAHEADDAAYMLARSYTYQVDEPGMTTRFALR